MALNAIEQLRPVVNSGRDDGETSLAYLLTIMFHGWCRLFDLIEMMPVGARLTTPTAFERAWELMHDAIDGLSHRPIDHPAFEWATERLQAVDSAFDRNFGKGMYASPEIICDYYACTICAKDIRTCEHIPGTLYGAKICGCSPAGESHIRSVAIVEEPRDPRCRIWPWQFTKDENNKVRINGVRLIQATKP